MAALFLYATDALAQQSDFPSDLSTPLAFTTGTGGEVVVCTSGSLTTGGTLSAMTSTAAALVPAPPCGAFVAGTSIDAWYRIDVPAAGDHRFRITLEAGATNPLSNGSMAAYVASSSAGPWQLIDCAIGGNPTSGQFTNPSLEVTCIPASSHIYVRVWDELLPASSKNFSLCVQGQIWDGSQQAIADTPCDVASSLTVGAALATFYNTFACDENFPLDPSCSIRRSGDVWLRTAVPTSGAINLSGAWGSNANRRALKMGFTLYTTTGTCADVDRFTEVGCVSTTLTSTETVLITARCLIPNSILWIRAYSTSDGLVTPARFGAFRIRVTNPGGTPGSATNNYPCTATPITIGSTCPTYTSGTLGFNAGACMTPGVPAPGCGTMASTTPDVWYRFVAPANGTAVIRVNGDNTSPPAFDPAIALYTAGNAACDGPLTLVECDYRQGAGSGAYIVRRDLDPGTTYYLRVWGEGTSGTQTGIFYVCITAPDPPSGYCYYVVRLTNQDTPGTQVMRVAVGTDTTDYVTSGEASQTFLVPVPIGFSVTFLYYNTMVIAPSTYSVFQFGSQQPIWTQTVGGAVIGPSPSPATQFTLTPACNPLFAPPEDCLGATTICGPAAINTSTTGRTGSMVDLTAANRGCLQDEYNGGSWYMFRATANGRVSFRLEGTTSVLDDLDFAIWDAGSSIYTPVPPHVTPGVCSPNGPPIRCSNARVNGRTGLDPGYTNRTWEGNSGFSWLEPLDVQTDHVYILFVANRQYTTARGFQLQWTQIVDAFGVTDNSLLDCTTILLPVELIFLRADKRASMVDLTWATASERDNSHFIVEHGPNMRDFEAIGKVDGAGTTQQRTEYLFTDEAPFTGVNYYRLRQVDLNGHSEHSQIVVATFDGSTSDPVIFPNPANDRINVIGTTPNAGLITMVVRDAMGRSVHVQYTSAQEGAFREEIAIGEFASGHYTLYLITGDGRKIGHARFVKR